MKKKYLYILWALFIYGALTAQNKTALDSLITIDFKNELLSDCIHKLEAKTHVFFSFRENDLKEEPKIITANFALKPASYVLDALLKNTKLNYKYLGGQVVLFKKKKTVTLSGFIKDAQSGEVLIGASIYIKNPMLGVFSNGYGFYSLTLPEDNYELFAAFLSNEKSIGRINLKKDTTFTILMSSEIELNEVEVKADNTGDRIKDAVTVERINIEDVKKIPTPFGEPDILRVIQMQPGIQTTGEACLGYYVRGGSIGQNLVLLDDAPVYNPTHLMGIVSAFNTDMVKSVDFYKGSIPSVYQSGASSVLDVRSRDGNNKTFHVGGGIGLISSRLFIEGPIKKEKGSFLLSGRKSALTDYIIKSGFYDLNLKASYELNSKNRIYISGYTGKDKFNYDSNGTKWDNKTFTLRYNHVYNGKFFSNTSLIYSKFSVGNKISSPDKTESISTSQFVESKIAKYVLSYFPKAGTIFNTGVYFNSLTYSPFKVHYYLPNSAGIDTTVDLTLERKAIEAAFFIDGTFNITRSIAVYAGIRAPFFTDKTRGTLYYGDVATNILDSVQFKPVTFKAIEPRVNISYLLKKNQSIKASYNHINQYQQQFQGGSLFNLTQVWLPSSSALNPQTVDQFSLGYFTKWKQSLFSVETFYKHINHVADFVNGSQFINEGAPSLLNVEPLLKEGTANSYGLELSINKTQGRLTGWLNYTFAKTMYKIAQINKGAAYPASFDNRHTASLGVMYELSKKWEFSSTFNFRSGRAFSFPDSYYELNGKAYGLITDRNKERTPYYHRLDISFIYKVKSKNNRFFSTWVFSLINVYNKFNPTYYTIDGKDVKGYALFPIFPSIAYNFRF